ncbi:hypothetical protein TNCV_3013991 [Trichonephila clavipes]|nr:hypothetical protein TNCV_3013991 [Trichonephila clavipes]
MDSRTVPPAGTERDKVSVLLQSTHKQILISADSTFVSKTPCIASWKSSEGSIPETSQWFLGYIISTKSVTKSDKVVNLVTVFTSSRVAIIMLESKLVANTVHMKETNENYSGIRDKICYHDYNRKPSSLTYNRKQNGCSSKSKKSLAGENFDDTIEQEIQLLVEHEIDGTGFIEIISEIHDNSEDHSIGEDEEAKNIYTIKHEE